MVVGEPGVGLGVGLLLQGVWSRSLPMGGVSPPAAGPAAVVGAALAGTSAGPVFSMGALAVPGAIPLVISLGAALGVAVLGRTLTRLIHRRRSALIRRVEVAAHEGKATTVALLNWSGAWPTAVLGAFLVVVGLAAGAAVQGMVSGTPALDGRWVAYPVLGAGLGQSLSLIRRGRVWWVWTGGCLVLLVWGWV